MDHNTANKHVVVCGGGPAGSTAAILLARRGVRVTLFEKSSFPRYKVCGGCLNTRALSLLREQDLIDLQILERGVPLQQFRWRSLNRTIELPIYNGLSLSRETLDAGMLRHAAHTGVEVVPDTRVLSISSSDRHVEVSVRAKATASRKIHADAIVCASGLADIEMNPPCRVQTAKNSFIGVGVVGANSQSAISPGVVFMHSFANGYLGLTVDELGRLSIAAALQPSKLTDLKKILADRGLHDGKLIGTPLLTRRRSGSTSERIFFVGDAASYVEPFTGRGIEWALESAIRAVPFVIEQLASDTPSKISRWNADYRRSIMRSQWTTHAARVALRSPAATVLLQRAITSAPKMLSPVLKQICGAPS